MRKKARNKQRQAAAAVFLSAVILLAGCQAQQSDLVPPESTPASLAPTAANAAPTAVQEPAQSHPAPAKVNLPMHQGEFFTASGACSGCHTGLVDTTGVNVSLDTDWRSTMMANAARDPYWQAGVRREIEAFPQYQEAIEDKCSTCHAPMARFTTHASGDKGQMLGEGGYSDPTHNLHLLAMDGVSCSACHQITGDNLGQPSAFSGGYQIDLSRPIGERVVYGMQNVSPPLASVMQAATGFVPVVGRHISQAAVCASCHTLHTQTIDENGEFSGDFPEQMPFVEWLHSDFSQKQACQDCHMPTAAGRAKISTLSSAERPQFSRHNTVAGNVYLLRMFEAFGPELGATASSDHFRASIDQALKQMQQDTAALSLGSPRIEAGTLYVEVRTTNLAGHKLPTGYPSRRAWLHLTVTDASGKVVFESGAPNPDGSIAGNANDEDELLFEPHYTLITQPDQVQIYEAIMVDTLEQVTTTLLRGARYIKDNRLLPAGFDKDQAPDDIAVWGAAASDPDFTGGGDLTAYAISLPDSQGPFTIQVSLLYQPVGYRWIESLRGHSATEIEFFLRLSDQVPNTPARVAEVQAEVVP